MGLTEAEDIKKRWQEYTEELYKKDPHDPDSHNGVITHLEPEILECKIKWALRRIITNKASGGDGIPVELFQILKDDSLKVLQHFAECQQHASKCHNMQANIENSAVAQGWKSSVFIPVTKKDKAKEYSNYLTIALISHSSKVMLKFFQSGFNST